MLLLGEIGERETNVGKETAGNEGDAIARHEFVRGGDRIARLAAVVARDDLERLAIDAALALICSSASCHPLR